MITDRKPCGDLWMWSLSKSMYKTPSVTDKRTKKHVRLLVCLFVRCICQGHSFYGCTKHRNLRGREGFLRELRELPDGVWNGDISKILVKLIYFLGTRGKNCAHICGKRTWHSLGMIKKTVCWAFSVFYLRPSNYIVMFSFSMAVHCAEYHIKGPLTSCVMRSTVLRWSLYCGFYAVLYLTMRTAGHLICCTCVQ